MLRTTLPLRQTANLQVQLIQTEVRKAKNTLNGLRCVGIRRESERLWRIAVRGQRVEVVKVLLEVGQVRGTGDGWSERKGLGEEIVAEPRLTQGSQ